MGSFISTFKLGKRPDDLRLATPVTPKLEIWYNADDGKDKRNFNQTLTNNSDVLQWRDRSKVAHNANQTGNSTWRPKYRTNILNSQGVVRFDGSANYLDINPMEWYRSKPGFSIFAVVKASSLSGTRTLFSTDDNNMRIWYTGGFWNVRMAGGFGPTTIAGDTTNFHIIGMIYNGSSTNNAGRLKFRYDAVDYQVACGTSIVGKLTGSATSRLSIGCDGGIPASFAGTNHFSGDIAEIVMFTRALPNNEVLGVERYLRTHWGL